MPTTSIAVRDANGASQTVATNDAVVAQMNAVSASTGNTHAPASNTAAVVTKSAPGAGVCNVIDGIAWSYDAAPTNGGLTITDGGSTVFQVAVTAAGPGFFLFPRPLKSAANSALVVTLAAGGSGVTGKVNVLGARTE